MIIAITNQKGGVGKTTTTANLGVLLARDGRQVLLVDADPQFALTRQLGIEERSLGVNLVDVLAGRASAEDAIVTGVHGVDIIATGREQGRDRHAAEPRAAHGQRARARRAGDHAGQC
jgi:chromosome partitioning protein